LDNLIFSHTGDSEAVILAPRVSDSAEPSSEASMYSATHVSRQGSVNGAFRTARVVQMDGSGRDISTVSRREDENDLLAEVSYAFGEQS
jgi:hypothetical protein